MAIDALIYYSFPPYFPLCLLPLWTNQLFLLRLVDCSFGRPVFSYLDVGNKPRYLVLYVLFLCM